MRVLIVNRHVFDSVGGSETQCHQIACRLAALGHTVTYAVCAPRRQSYDTPYEAVPLLGSTVTAFRDALRSRRPDVVYWRRNKTYLFRCVLAARQAGVPFVFAVSSSLDLTPYGAIRPPGGSRSILQSLAAVPAGILRTLNSAANYAGLWFVDGIVFQHPGQARQRSHRRQRVIYNFSSRSAARPAATTVPYVLWLGSLKPVKSPETYFQLAADLSDQGVEFRMAGSIHDENYRRMLDDPARIPKNLRYLGARSPAEVDALLSGSLFLASTSSNEGFPNVFVEAWRQSRCVASMNCDLGGILESEGIGTYADDYEKFRSDVARLIQDRPLRESMGARAFEFASRNCEPEDCVKELESFLLEVSSA